MNEIGIKYKKIKAEPLISQKHEVRRLEFAKNHLKDDWTTTLFVDEASIWTHCYP